MSEKLTRPIVTDQKYDIKYGNNLFNDELYSEDRNEYIDQLEAEKKELRRALLGLVITYDNYKTAEFRNINSNGLNTAKEALKYTA